MKPLRRHLWFCVCCRWLVLDTDTRDLVSMHTDGNEIISNVKYSPGKTSPGPPHP